jgi:protocatechuate 3,4-dioxygenase beta subunit
MDGRRLALLLALLALFGGGLFALWKSIGSTGEPAREAAVTGDDGLARDRRDAARDASALEAPAAANDRARERAETPSVASASTKRDENFSLDGARWLEGSITMPAGAPPDESLVVWVVALQEKGFNGQMMEADALLGMLHKGQWNEHWSRRAVDASGRFKAPLAAGAKSAEILLDGRFLYLAQAKVVAEKDFATPIVLEPELGAVLALRCIAPANASPDDSPAGARTTLRGYTTRPSTSSRARPTYVNRDSALGADGTIELRALPLELRYSLSVVPQRLATATSSEIALEAGKTTELVLHLKRGARVSGRVLDEARKPLAGVKVSSSVRTTMRFGPNAPEERSAETNANGEYDLAGLRAGKQRLAATMEDWADGQSDELALKDEQEMTGVDIVLSRGATITGHVTWPDGKPAKDAGVQALDASEKRPRFGATGKVRGTRTDASGKFSISGLEKGPFLVNATARELSSSNVDAKSADAAAAIASSIKESVDASGAEVVALGYETQSVKKATVWVASQPDVKLGSGELALVLHAPAGLTGRVVDGAGDPLRAFSVEVGPDWQTGRFMPDRALHSQEFKSDDGSFRVDDVNDGDWTVTVRAKGYSQSGSPPSVGVPQSGEPLVIKMVVAATVTGVVVDPAGKPVQDAEVKLRPQGETNRFSYGENGSAKSDDKGAFTLKNVAAGSWQVSASAENWAHSEPTPIQVGEGANVASLELHLRAGGTIAGEVYDARGAHVSGRQVQLFSMAAGDGKQAAIDASGSFKAEHLSPGAYQVMLEPSAEDQAAMMEKASGEEPDMGEVLSKLKMTSCEVKEGEITHVVLGAPPKSPVKLTGRITQGGEPVTKCTLVVLNEGGALLQSLKIGKVDASGHYELTIDKPGDVVLVVTKELGRAKGVDFYLTVPEVPEYSIDLSLPISAIRGSVRGPDGAPLASVPVQLMRDSSGANIMMMDGPASEHTDDSGRFEFADLQPGTYAVAAGGSSGPFSVEQGSYGRAVRGSLRVEKDRVLDNVDLKLVPGSKISGTVRDASGNAVSGANVYVRDAQGELLSRFSACTSEANGKFTYKGVAPGTYTLTARTKTLAARDGASVVVREGETSEADVVLEAGTMLRVSTVDKDEKPLKAAVSVRDERGFEVGSMTALDAMQEAFAQGVSSTEQKIGPLPAGKYVVTATAPDGRTAKKAVTLKGQDERKLTVRVE